MFGSGDDFLKINERHGKVYRLKIDSPMQLEYRKKTLYCPFHCHSSLLFIREPRHTVPRVADPAPTIHHPPTLPGFFWRLFGGSLPSRLSQFSLVLDSSSPGPQEVRVPLGRWMYTDGATATTATATGICIFCPPACLASSIRLASSRLYFFHIFFAFARDPCFSAIHHPPRTTPSFISTLALLPSYTNLQPAVGPTLAAPVPRASCK